MMIYPNPVKFIAINPEFLQNSPNLTISFQFLYSGNYVIIAGKKYPLGVPVSTPYGEFTILPDKKYTPLSHPETDTIICKYALLKMKQGHY